MKYIKTAVILIGILAVGLFTVSIVKDIAGRDKTAPEILSDREVLEIPCDYSQEQLLEGLSASDKEDGDLTSQILAGSTSRFIEKGVCSITYVVFDSKNQSGSLTRKIRFTDYVSPRFSLAQPLVFVEETGNYEEVKKCITATDMLDGDLNDWIVQVENDISFSKAGAYSVTMEVSNSFGDSSEVSFPVHIVSAASQALQIGLNSSLAYIQKGQEINPYDYVGSVTDRSGNSLGIEGVYAESNVDVNTPGTYEIHYIVQDAAGNLGETWLTVVVEE